MIYYLTDFFQGQMFDYLMGNGHFHENCNEPEIRRDSLPFLPIKSPDLIASHIASHVRVVSDAIICC